MKMIWLTTTEPYKWKLLDKLKSQLEPYCWNQTFDYSLLII